MKEIQLPARLWRDLFAVAESQISRGRESTFSLRYDNLTVTFEMEQDVEALCTLRVHEDGAKE